MKIHFSTENSTSPKIHKFGKSYKPIIKGLHFSDGQSWSRIPMKYERWIKLWDREQCMRWWSQIRGWKFAVDIKSRPYYPAIINITKQLSITGEPCVLKSPVVVLVIKNLAQKADAKLKIEADQNDLDRLGINDKNKWTNDLQRLRVLELLYFKSQPRSEIARNLCIPYATICRIIRNWEQSPTSISSLFKFRKVRIQKWRRAQVKTLEFIKSQSGVFNSANIKHYIKTETGVNINQQSITSYLKSILGLSYKRMNEWIFRAIS